MFGFLVSIPLLITSNWISVWLLWKKWKGLQRLSYLMFIFVALHIFLIKKEIWSLIIVWVWFLLYVFAFIKSRKNSKIISSWVKWLCVPCGYIYDVSFWDPDSWIKPWTRFEDIPSDWRCPVCWVTKADFIKLDSFGDWNIIKWDVIWKNIVNQNIDVLELEINLDNEIEIIQWQFITFVFSDKKWDFNRSYSVVSKTWKFIKFLIKLNKESRWSDFLNNLNLSDKVQIVWVFWKFTLQNTENKKVFIASGTWLAPIYNMIINFNWNKILFFWLKNKWDLFYLDKLKNIKNLEVYVCLSREDKQPENISNIHFYNWRFDCNLFIENWIIDLKEDPEFYICWNNELVESVKNSLTQCW